ncbi:MAG: hypothetical protein J6W11_03085 [Alphaproteobacteria bacterium]|nr:hypothetical protein [Alphaproteobacteria bacterium]
MVKNFFSNFKKHIHILYYAIFACLSFYSVTMLISCYDSIKAVRNGEYIQQIDPNSPIWIERSSRHIIMHEKLIMAYFIFFISISLVYVFNKKPKTAVFVQLLAYLVAVLGSYFLY